jgi:hypothetical protein
MKQKRLLLQQRQQLPTTTIRIRTIIIIFPPVRNYRHMGECMHRLWQHTITITIIDMDMDHTNTTTTISTDNDDDDDKDDVVTTKLLLVIFTIPQGMFVDLDDPIPWKESGRIYILPPIAFRHGLSVTLNNLPLSVVMSAHLGTRD